MIKVMIYNMILPTLLVSLLTAAGTTAQLFGHQDAEPYRYTFSNPPKEVACYYRMPTIRESTAMARKILHLTTIGDLVTSFPQPSHGSGSALEVRPDEVAGSPIGLMEYYADCDPASGDPIVLAINIATPYRNYVAGSNISLAVRWWPKQRTSYSFLSSLEIPTPHTPAALPRFSLHGSLQPIPEEKLADGKIKQCFLKAHPDSIYWQPGNDISHSSQYMQLHVEQVYWFGGFGDRARIGWLPIELWRNLTMEEIIEAKLPGESKRKTFSLKEWL